MRLGDNLISDISPLLQNDGINEGDGIDLRGNPLNENALNIYIPQLDDPGVEILYNFMPGDANGNGDINVLDMTCVARKILGLD